MSWFDEDPELLRAALEIIETWDEGTTGDCISVRSPLTDGMDSAVDERDDAVELDDSGDDAVTELNADGSLLVTMRLPPLEIKPLETTKSESRTLAPRELKPSTIASTRHRRREEIIFLRNKVKEMEGQLALLEKVKVEDAVSTNGAASADKALTAMWHDIASRQQRLRQKSELDQAKLRKLLQTQMKVAEGLMKLMQKARRMDEDEVFLQKKRMKLTSRPVLLDEGQQIARLHSHYDNLDAAFAFRKFHDGSLKFVDIEVTDELEEEVIIEYREAWTLPFDMDCVLDAMWEYTLRQNEEKWCKPDYHTSTTQRLEGTELVSRFAATSTLGGFTGSFNGQVITKRFPGTDEKTRAIIKVLNTEPDHATPGDISGFYMHNDTWIRVLPANQAAQDAGGRHCTRVQCTERFRMQFEENAQKARQAAGAITNMILDKLQDDLEMKHNTVETLLLRSRSK